MKNMWIFADEWRSELEVNRQTASADLPEKINVGED
jgi:hypothetical protein